MIKLCVDYTFAIVAFTFARWRRLFHVFAFAFVICACLHDSCIKYCYSWGTVGVFLYLGENTSMHNYRFGKTH